MNQNAFAYIKNILTKHHAAINWALVADLLGLFTGRPIFRKERVFCTRVFLAWLLLSTVLHSGLAIVLYRAASQTSRVDWNSFAYERTCCFEFEFTKEKKDTLDSLFV